MITSLPDLLKGLFLGLIIGALGLFIIVRFGLLPIVHYVCP